MALCDWSFLFSSIVWSTSFLLFCFSSLFFCRLSYTQEGGYIPELSACLKIIPSDQRKPGYRKISVFNRQMHKSRPPPHPPLTHFRCCCGLPQVIPDLSRLSIEGDGSLRFLALLRSSYHLFPSLCCHMNRGRGKISPDILNPKLKIKRNVNFSFSTWETGRGLIWCRQCVEWALIPSKLMVMRSRGSIKF